MEYINCRGQIPYAAQLARLRAQFTLPVGVPAKPCTPFNNVAVGIDNAHGDTLVGSHDSSLTENQPCKHTFVALAFNKESALTQWDVPANTECCKERADCVSVNIVAFSDKRSAFTQSIRFFDGLRVLLQFARRYGRVKGYILGQKKTTHSGVVHTVSEGEIVNACSVLIAEKNFVFAFLKSIATSRLVQFIPLVYRIPFHPLYTRTDDNSNCCVFKHLAGRELDGRTWDEYPAVAA